MLPNISSAAQHNQALALAKRATPARDACGLPCPIIDAASWC
jgi:hypothetical protein